MTGKELKALRKKFGMTQRELAKKTGLNQGDISLYESTRRELAQCWPYINEKFEAVFYGDQE